MRIEKRGRGAVYGLQIEANRTAEDHAAGRDFDRSDVDWTRTQENVHLVKTDNWNKEITRQIHAAGLKERKNSTVLLDGLYTASPQWFAEHTPQEAEQYFRDCLAFHVQEYCGGDSSRVINAVVHLDEATPHMQVASVPIIEDEKGAHLSAKIICGGRQDFRLHQDHFFEQVAKTRGLDRGEVRDAAAIKAHTTKREYQLATQEQALERARRETRAEQAKTQEVIDRRQASIEQANRQKLEALRERDKARAWRDVVKALSEAQDAVLSPVAVDVDILSEAKQKKTFTGKVKPATVTIEREELERLQKQATVNEQTRRAAASMTQSLKGMWTAARDANENRIDKQAAADRAAVSAEGQRAESLERDLFSTRAALRQEREKTADLSKQLDRQKDKAQTLDALEQAFPKSMERLQQILAYEREYDRRHRISKADYQKYQELCGATHIDARKDIQPSQERARAYDDELSL